MIATLKNIVKCVEKGALVPCKVKSMTMIAKSKTMINKSKPMIDKSQSMIVFFIISFLGMTFLRNPIS